MAILAPDRCSSARTALAAPPASAAATSGATVRSPAAPRLRPLFAAQRAQCFMRDRDRGFCREVRRGAFRAASRQAGGCGAAAPVRDGRAGSSRGSAAAPGRRRALRARRGAHPLARAAVVQADKIDDDAAAEIAQPDLPGDGTGSGEIDRERRCAPASPFPGSRCRRRSTWRPAPPRSAPSRRRRARWSRDNASSKTRIKIDRPFGFPDC